MARTLQSTLLALALLCGNPVLAQGTTTLYRCVLKGQTTFQQQPCPANSSAEEMRVVPSNTEQALPAPPSPASTAAPAPEPQPAQVVPAKSALELEAEQCLDHIRSFLRDPRSAYASAPSREGRVLSLTVYATNLRGGVSAKRAACEMFNGVVDGSWTRINLERLGWFARRGVVVRRDGRKMLQQDYDDIEARP
jgi:hypothetical protein